MNHYEFTKSFQNTHAVIKAVVKVKKVLKKNNMPKAYSTVTFDGNSIKFQVTGNISALMLIQVLGSSWDVAPVGSSTPLPMVALF